MKTVCKFRCDSVTDMGHAKSATFAPVTSGSDENKAFWKATPSGSLQLGYLNPDVKFEPGKEYFLEITLAETTKPI